MDWGMKNRLSRLIQKDGKALFLPIDHGYFQGPTHGLEHPEETIKPIYQYADALMLTRGVLRNCIDPSIEKPIIMRVSGAVSVVGEDLAAESVVTSIQEILRLNASAVSMSVFVGVNLALVGFINVPIIKFSVEWWNTLHQPASIFRAGGPTIDPSLLTPLFVMAAGFTLLFVLLHLIAMRAEILRRRVHTLRQVHVERAATA